MTASAYELFAFGLFAAITLGSSIGVVLVRDVWHAVLLLGVSLLSVAIHFVLLQAEFLAVIQVLVYVGGVLVLVSFAVMLVRRRDTDPSLGTRPELNFGQHLLRGIPAVALFGVLAAAILATNFAPNTGFTGGGITASIGYAIIGLTDLATQDSENFLVALIAIAIVLDAALDAAVMLARRDDPDHQPVTDGGHTQSEGGSE